MRGHAATLGVSALGVRTTYRVLRASTAWRINEASPNGLHRLFTLVTKVRNGFRFGA